MGGGGGGGSQQMLNTCYHMNGVQKAYQDWLGGCNIVKVTSSGTFTVFPLEKACNGIQLLQVPLPEARTLTFPPSPVATLRSGVMTAYYVELRAPVGLDAPLGNPRVFLVAAGDLREARQRGNPNWLIDTTPETRSVLDAHLTVGKTYSDPAPNGPKITVMSADATKAVIQVQLGTAPATGAGMGTCSDMMPFVGPGPAECNAAPMAPPGTPTPPDGGPVATPDASAPAPDMGGGTNPPTNPPPTNPPPGNPPPDAGTMPRPMMPPSGGADAATAPAPAVPSGCSCRVGGDAGAPAGAALLALAMLGLMVRRRRR
jgi:MYXO-CTERM domain-containing protein